MDLNLNLESARGYKSHAQIARVLTERWVFENAFCPHCGEDHLIKDPNNARVLDFHCPSCNQGFELKSKSGKFGRKVVDGEYFSMINRITSSTNPDFFLLNYHPKENRVTDFFMIPKHFITPTQIEKRSPLADTARRSGWVGCNILVESLPLDGLVYFVRNSVVIEKDDVIRKLKQTKFLERVDVLNRGWIVDIMRCIDTLEAEFKLSDLYDFEGELQKLHPENHHIQAKIRQQLQFLRDVDYIEFCGRGLYRKM